MKLSKWMLLTAVLLTAALCLTGCMNSGNRVDTAAPSPSVGATGNTGDVGDSSDTNQSGLAGDAGTGAATPLLGQQRRE